MSTIKTKYNLKQVVYNAYCTHDRYYIECEDCGGTGYWQIAGKDKEVGCHTCNKEGSWVNNPGKIAKFKHFPKVRQLTIGQVRATIGYDAGVVYMCKESGTGSGTLWPENQLMEEEQKAIACANELADLLNSGVVMGYDVMKDFYKKWED
tara:strand:+ start:21332 stop:21781 length:450 start_codon:yes stop_codon:yes gene_type:complete